MVWRIQKRIPAGSKLALGSRGPGQHREARERAPGRGDGRGQGLRRPGAPCGFTASPRFPAPPALSSGRPAAAVPHSPTAVPPDRTQHHAQARGLTWAEPGHVSRNRLSSLAHPRSIPGAGAELVGTRHQEFSREIAEFDAHGGLGDPDTEASLTGRWQGK